MATIPPIGEWVSRGVHKTTWANITNISDIILPQSAPNLPDKTVTMSGTFAAVTLYVIGSNDGINYSRLHDANGNELILDSVKTEEVLESPAFMKLEIGVALIADVDVIIYEYEDPYYET